MEEFEVLSNGMHILQTEALFRLGTDSILLANFCGKLHGGKIADLGCGGGALGVLLCAADSGCHVTGIELQPAACEIAERNIRINQLEDRFSVINGDIRHIQELMPANGFDCVVSNPPYFPVGSGGRSQSESMAIARTEVCCTPESLCMAAQWLLRYGGSFCFVHRPERLAEMIYTLKAHKLEPKRLRFVRHSPGAPVSLFLMSCTLGGKSGLQVENELLLHTASGEPTAEYLNIYHMN